MQVLLLILTRLFFFEICSGFELNQGEGASSQLLSDIYPWMDSSLFDDPEYGRLIQQYPGHVPSQSQNNPYLYHGWYKDVGKPNPEDTYNGQTQPFDKHFHVQGPSSFILMFHPPYHQGINTETTRDDNDILTSSNSYNILGAFQSTCHDTPLRELDNIQHIIDGQTYLKATHPQMKCYSPKSEIDSTFIFSDEMHPEHGFAPESVDTENPLSVDDYLTASQEYNTNYPMNQRHPNYHVSTPRTSEVIFCSDSSGYPFLSSHPHTSTTPKTQVPELLGYQHIPLLNLEAENHISSQEFRTTLTPIHPHGLNEQPLSNPDFTSKAALDWSQLLDSSEETRNPAISEDSNPNSYQHNGIQEYNGNIPEYHETSNKRDIEKLEPKSTLGSQERKDVWNVGQQNKKQIIDLIDGKYTTMESKKFKNVAKKSGPVTQKTISHSTPKVNNNDQFQDIATSKNVFGNSPNLRIGAFAPIKRNGHRNPDRFSIFQSVGIMAVNRSPTLCYKVYEWFLELEDKMHKRFRRDIESIEVHLAVRNAGYEVVMAFLGILKVFEYNGSGNDELQDILEAGWTYMKNFYDQWNNKEICATAKLDKHIEKDWSLDPQSQLIYLKHKKETEVIALGLVHSMSIDFSNNRGNSKVPIRFSPEDWDRLVKVYSEDSTSTEGGLYLRGNIKNNSFQAAEKLSGIRSTSKTINMKKQLVLLASDAAQFHTPIGRDMCRDVHIFFEQLNHSLHASYRSKNRYHLGQLLKTEELHQFNDKNKTNMDQIVQAISMAQYKVTVVYIGLIRAFNQKTLSEGQLQILVQNAWDFLKHKFSQWESIDFQAENHPQLFNYHENHVPLKTNDLNLPEVLFRSLSGYYHTYNVPISCVLHLLRSWTQHRQNTKPGPENFLDFPIKTFPPVPFSKWKSYMDIL
ncbi:hypothetical protein DFH28DRAFT_890447 [Melampsora americana]|nr:hypothetical protein DFH28DRAFT_890447 [Melampsora americana]